MPRCPRCDHWVKPTDLVCGTCQLTLKAHGHPSIELHRAAHGTALCVDCLYHADDSCTFPQRPHAQTCTLYQPTNSTPQPGNQPERSRANPAPLTHLWQRHKIWVILLGIFALSLLLTLR